MRTTASTTTLRPRARQARAAGTRHHIVAPSLCVADAAAASVFSAARARGPIARDVIAQVTQLSIATVNRQVTALLDAGMLRERADLAVSGAIGRPRVPVEVNHEPFLTLGIHIGARTTSIVATDLFGRTLDVVETPTPRGAQGAALASLAGSARRYLSRWHRRRPLWVGGGRRRRRRRHHRIPRPPAAGLVGRPGRSGAGRDAQPAGVGRVARRRDGRGRAAAGRAPEAPRRRRPACTSMPAKPSATRCRSAGGALAGQRAGHHRRAARPLGAAGRHRPAGVDGQRRGGADRRAQGAHHPGRGPGVDDGGGGAGGPAGQRAGPRLAGRAGPGARRGRGAAARHAQPRRPGRRRAGVHRVPRGDEAGGGRLRRALRAAAARYPRDRVRQPGAGSRAGVVSLGGLYADPIGAMRRARPSHRN